MYLILGVQLCDCISTLMKPLGKPFFQGPHHEGRNGPGEEWTCWDRGRALFQARRAQKSGRKSGTEWAVNQLRSRLEVEGLGKGP